MKSTLRMICLRAPTDVMAYIRSDVCWCPRKSTPNSKNINVRRASGKHIKRTSTRYIRKRLFRLHETDVFHKLSLMNITHGTSNNHDYRQTGPLSLSATKIKTSKVLILVPDHKKRYICKWICLVLQKVWQAQCF